MTTMLAKTNLPAEELMWEALLKRDTTYDGIFWVCVKTTGIFCRPGCTARNPKRENVEFTNTSKEALLRGYRPCKICRPMQPQGTAPEWIAPLLQEIQENPEERINDGVLRARGLDPSRVRRWFKKHYQLTFHAYQRSLRINRAFGAIRQGDKVIEAAFSQGYESLSGFTDQFRQSTGFAPSDSKNQSIIQITRLLTPLGPMVAGATEQGICLLEFADRRMLETQLKTLSKRLNAVFLPGENPHFSVLDQQLKEYFAGKRRTFNLPLVLPGTDFQKAVWQELQRIPYGATRSYQEQANHLGNPKAVRAVARANGDNRISIIIPCHRVIGSDGHLTGYGGGLWRKQYLLETVERGMGSSR